MIKARKTLAIAALLCLALIASMTSVFAIEIEPFFTHTSDVRAELDINNSGRATMFGTVVGNPGTSSITINATLNRINPNGTTTQIAAFRNIRANSGFLAWERIHHVARGHNYRLTITSTVIRNGSSETITVNSRIVRAN